MLLVSLLHLLATPIDFARDVQPIFQRACLSCHGPEKGKGGLRLHTRASFLAGGGSGPLVGPGRGSLLLQRLTGEGEGERMPPEGPPLSQAELGAIAAWVAKGAPWPEESEPECAAPRLEVAPLRRLSNAEYGRSIRDLFGLALDPTADLHLPEDPVVDGFDNNQSALSVSALHVERYRAAAERISREALGEVVVCNPASMACRRQLVTQWATRVWRRPPTAEERRAILGLVSKAPGGPRAGVASLLELLLQSPNFLYRVERGRPLPGRPGVHALTGHELATRLSYALWGSTPPPDLQAAASAGVLSSAAGIESWARRLLKDPRAQEQVRSFYSQWLQLPELMHVRRPTKLYKNWSRKLKESMIAATTRFVDELVWTEGADFLDVLTAPHAWVDERLARLYGLERGAGWRRITFGPESPRLGLLTQPSVLAVSAPGGEVVAPILRGKYVRDVFLCTPPPPPPPDVPAPPSETAVKNVRALLEEHRRNPACKGCHGLLEPLGFGFERYDLAGAYRHADRAGKPLTAQGELRGVNGEPRFVDVPELARRLRSLPDVPACMTKQALRFLRGQGSEDICATKRALGAFEAANHNLPELLVAIVTSDEFRFVKAPVVLARGDF